MMSGTLDRQQRKLTDLREREEQFKEQDRAPPKHTQHMGQGINNSSSSTKREFHASSRPCDRTR